MYPIESRFEFPIRVEQSGAKLKWSFQVQGGDIDFRIVSTARDQRQSTPAAARTPDVCVALGRVGANSKVVEGEVDVPSNAEQLWLVWDNSFSWWTQKSLRYSVHLLYETHGKILDAASDGEATSSADRDRQRNEMLVTLCNVMRQLHHNQQKLEELGRNYQVEQHTLMDLQMKQQELQSALAEQQSTEKAVLERERQLMGTMNALVRVFLYVPTNTNNNTTTDSTLMHDSS
mgnify:CR=1 FL=1